MVCAKQPDNFGMFVGTAKKECFGFQVSPLDPCMLFKQNDLRVCIIILYVDDKLIIGGKEQIQEFATKIQKLFSVKIQHNLADYLGCEFHINKSGNKRMAWTSLYNQEFRAKIWQDCNEGKTVTDAWDTKIHCKKAREPCGQGKP